MHSSNNQQQNSRASRVAHALTFTLLNPHRSSGYQYAPGHYSTHYAQAYNSQQATTPDGFTLSSTYGHDRLVGPSTSPAVSSSRNQSSHLSTSRQPSRGYGSWYEPGNARCTSHGCNFIGSKKSVEIHMMDRHLIYPPGWEKRNKRPDWDADPSLKNGKPIPIMGTNVVLDTPEAIDSWLAERKKRWPTANRVNEKTKKLNEAIDRGQIAAYETALKGMKRQRNSSSTNVAGRGRGFKRGRGGHAPAPGRTTDENKSMPVPERIPHALPPRPLTQPMARRAPFTAAGKIDMDSDLESSDSDVNPERDAVSSKAPAASLNLAGSSSSDESDSGASPEAEPIGKSESTVENGTAFEKDDIHLVVRKSAPQPKGIVRNPFASRPSLLRNLLLPEIRMTVSNLSQAIRFLVENNFLEGVELSPGEAESNAIEVIGSKDNM